MKDSPNTPPADEPELDNPLARELPADEPELDNPLARELADVGLITGEDGLVQVKMLVGASNDEFSGQKDEVKRFDPVLALRLVQRGYAEPCNPEE